MEKFFEIFESNKPNGEEYLYLVDSDLPIRIKNITKGKFFSSEIEFYRFLEKLLYEYTSYYLFPNNYVAFYPYLEQCHSKKETTCNISGTQIKKGNLYYYYRPLIENLSTGNIYTIQKTIKVAEGYQDILPTNIHNFEAWYQKLACKNFYDDDVVDFYNLSIMCGESCLHPYQLRKTKKH